MATTLRPIATLLAAAIALIFLGSCGRDGGGSGRNDSQGTTVAGAVQPSPLFPDNFKGVCSGASVSSATAYDPSVKAHKALYFATYKDDLMDQSSSLPGDWTVLFSANGDALKAIDLVVCAKRTAAREVKVCDGFKKDDKPTQNKVRWHTATYEISVREAKTGRTLGQTTFEATDSDCPMLQMFDGDSETVDGYASLPDSVVADFLRPHITR